MITVVCCHCNAPLPNGNGWWLIPCPRCGKDPAIPIDPADDDTAEWEDPDVVEE